MDREMMKDSLTLDELENVTGGRMRMTNARRTSSANEEEVNTCPKCGKKFTPIADYVKHCKVCKGTIVVQS